MQQLIVQHVHFTQIDYTKDDVLIISEAIIDALVFSEEYTQSIAIGPS